MALDGCGCGGNGVYVTLDGGTVLYPDPSPPAQHGWKVLLHPSNPIMFMLLPSHQGGVSSFTFIKSLHGCFFASNSVQL